MTSVADPSAADPPLVVVCLCAAWCDTCRAFRPAIERLVAQREATFVWLDIEDDADRCGDIEVENFPTLAVYRGRTLLHYGVSLPLEGHVARLLDEMRARNDAMRGAPPEVLALVEALGPAP